MLKFYICIGLFSKEPEAFSCQLKAAVLSLICLRKGKKFKAFLNLVVSRLRNDKSNLKKLDLSQFFFGTENFIDLCLMNREQIFAWGDAYHVANASKKCFVAGSVRYRVDDEFQP